jgi:excinuclease ABC subunit B
VAVLDADKEGFLRSETSLIQTVGRAARNINGKAILYAEKMTGSMQRAIEETERRRNKQTEFNVEHGITPAGVKKAITDIMEGAYSEGRGRKKWAKVAEQVPDYLGEPPELLLKRIKQLEEQMYRHARDLEFEEAARLRDQIHEIRTRGLGLPEEKAG